MSEVPQVRTGDKLQDLKAGANRLSAALKTRGSSYDGLFAWTEGIATVASGGLFAFGGAAMEAGQNQLGIVLLVLGVLFTIGAVFLVFKRDRGVLEVMIDATNAANDAAVVQLEADNAVLRARQALNEQAQAVALAKSTTEAERLALETDRNDKLAALDQTWNALDRQRRARLLAMRKMVEVVEAALLHKGDVKFTAQKLLDDANEHMRRVIRCTAEDYFTVSIFRRETRNPTDGERMHRIGCYATVSKEKSYDDLSWAKGKGYTGTLWNDATANAKADLALPDTTAPGIREKFPVDDFDPEREARYISVAAFPILIERTENVWGVVTSTIDRTGVFERIDGRATQGVEMVRDIAYVAALLAGLDAPTGL